MDMLVRTVIVCLVLCLFIALFWFGPPLAFIHRRASLHLSKINRGRRFVPSVTPSFHLACCSSPSHLSSRHPSRGPRHDPPPGMCTTARPLPPSLVTSSLTRSATRHPAHLSTTSPAVYPARPTRPPAASAALKQSDKM
jgi:hypothetical protein